MLEPILRELFQARDFQDICQKSHHVRDKLQKLSCFKDIKITIDASQGAGASKNGYEVSILLFYLFLMRNENSTNPRYVNPTCI